MSDAERTGEDFEEALEERGGPRPGMGLLW